jgi:small subunit ribosomal protein S13
MFCATNHVTSKGRVNFIMIRISGVVLPDNKQIQISLTSLYGIGRSIALEILKEAKVDPTTKTKDLTAQEEVRIRAILDKNHKLEGDLRSVIASHIRRLKDIHSFRGIRHSKNLPLRGQRTKTNARTKRGRKVTVGSGRKKSAEKT